MAPRPFIIPIFLPNRGCPHRCTFCDQTSITGEREKGTLPDVDKHVNRFLSYRREGRGRVEIAFFGGNFLGMDQNDVVFLLSEAGRFVDDGLVDGIRFSTRPDTITRESLSIIKDFPVTTIEIGVQSMDDDVLRLSRRGHTSSCCAEAILLSKQNGYSTGAQTMTGLPGDTGKQSIETAEKLVALGPDFVRIYPTVIIKGSPLAAMYGRGEYSPQTLQEAIELAKILFGIYERAGIQVIRMGLQPTEELDGGQAVLAGPYHPSFGYLVRSAVLLEKVEKALNGHDTKGKSLTITLHTGEGATLRGLGNINIERLKNSFMLESVRIAEDEKVPPGKVVCATSQESL